jgi:hypothetical protein
VDALRRPGLCFPDVSLSWKRVRFLKRTEVRAIAASCTAHELGFTFVRGNYSVADLLKQRHCKRGDYATVEGSGVFRAVSVAPLPLRYAALR